MKFLVTGAAGFVGYYLAKKLSEEGSYVVGIDNINDYYDVRLKYARLEKLGINRSDLINEQLLIQSESHSNLFFQKLDLVDRSGLEKLFADHNFDVVINLAAQAGVRYSIENPYAYIDSNIVGFLNILECCRHNNIKHLVYASSSSVYGMNTKVPFSENDRVDEPVSLYAATKKSNELMAYTYSHLYKIPTTGLRFFTVYGPWGRPDMAPILFAKAISEDQSIKVFNNGDMMRDFTYIDDIVEGIARVIDNVPSSEEKTPFYRVLNIGNSEPVSLMDFINTIESEMGIEARLEMLPMQPGDVKRTYADTSNLNRITGYKPETSLQQGISEFINWYKWFVLNK